MYVALTRIRNQGTITQYWCHDYDDVHTWTDASWAHTLGKLTIVLCWHQRLILFFRVVQKWTSRQNASGAVAQVKTRMSRSRCTPTPSTTKEQQRPHCNSDPVHNLWTCLYEHAMNLPNLGESYEPPMNQAYVWTFSWILAGLWTLLWTLKTFSVKVHTSL